MIKKKPLKGKKDVLYVAGIIGNGENKHKYVAIKIRNTMLLNPVAPIFEQYPDMECVVVGKNEKTVRKNFEKLIS